MQPPVLPVPGCQLLPAGVPAMARQAGPRVRGRAVHQEDPRREVPAEPRDQGAHHVHARRGPPDGRRRPRRPGELSPEEGAGPRQELRRVEALRDDLAGRVEAHAAHDALVLIPGKENILHAVGLIRNNLEIRYHSVTYTPEGCPI